MRPLIPAALLLPLFAATLSAQSLRLEAERAPEDAAHPAHYAAARFPDDKWWSDVSFPGGTIAAIRGNDGSHGAHRLIWNLEIPESTEQTLVHDVRARVLISHNGAYNLSFQVDDAVPLKTTAEADKGTWQWVTLGSVLLPPGTHRLALEITTNASAVRVDAVELIPVPDVLAVHALPEPVWVAGEPNAFFIEADAAELSFRLPSARFSSAVARAIGPFGTSTQTLEAVIAPEHPDTIRVRVPARGWWQVQVCATRDGQTQAQTQKSFSADAIVALLGPALPEEQFRQFMRLVTEHCKQERSVSFYAGEMCLSSKHLSAVVKRISGRTAGEWIDSLVILEAKVMLKSSEASIQEIAEELHFANQSFFGKYFKQHAGMSPKAYRKQQVGLQDS